MVLEVLTFGDEELKEEAVEEILGNARDGIQMVKLEEKEEDF